jgi:hypothetical protein
VLQSTNTNYILYEAPNFAEMATREIGRIRLPRTRVNKGKRKGRSPKAPARSVRVLSVAGGLRLRTSLCASGFSRIVRREGRICRRFWGLVVKKCGMAHRLRVIRSAVVARHEWFIDGKNRGTYCSHQQRRGGSDGYHSLDSTQRNLLMISFPF